MTDNSPTRTLLTRIGGLYAILVLAAYILVYEFNPFSHFINRLISNSLNILAALTCALILTIIIRFYQPGEPPRRIWLYFAASLWMWTLGEIIWAAYNLTVGEVPGFSLADVVWALAYVSFTAAIVNQYRLVFFDTSKRAIWIAAITWLTVLAATSLTLTILNTEAFFEEFLTYFYPFADFAMGAASLILVITFRRGSLARPWLSLFAFVFADSFYIWATTTGAYNWTNVGGVFTFATDMTYLLAYLIMGWGVFQQYLTLRFGPAAPRASTPAPRPRL
jgi:hypothetical protein